MVGEDVGQQDWRPRPDPTTLTTEALHREIAAARELFGMQLARLEAKMLGQWELTAERDVHINNELNVRIAMFTQIRSEDKRVLDARFDHLDKVRGEDKREARALVDLALAAQKEMTSTALAAANLAIDKATIATDKRYDTLTVAMDAIRSQVGQMMPRAESESRHAAAVESSASLGMRLTAIEANKVGAVETRSEARASMTAATAVTSVIVALAIAVVTIVSVIMATRP